MGTESWNPGTVRGDVDASILRKPPPETFCSDVRDRKRSDTLTRETSYRAGPYFGGSRMTQNTVTQIGRLIGLRGSVRIYRLPMRPAYAVVDGGNVRLARTLREATSR